MCFIVDTHMITRAICKHVVYMKLNGYRVNLPWKLDSRNAKTMDDTPLNQLVTWMSRFFNLRVHQKHLKPIEAAWGCTLGHGLPKTFCWNDRRGLGQWIESWGLGLKQNKLLFVVFLGNSWDSLQSLFENHSFETRATWEAGRVTASWGEPAGIRFSK